MEVQRPMMRLSHGEHLELTLKEGGVDASPEHRILIWIFWIEVEGELILFQDLLFNDVVKERCDATGGHVGKTQPRDTFERDVCEDPTNLFLNESKLLAFYKVGTQMKI